jgi:hypothetical protein
MRGLDPFAPVLTSRIQSPRERRVLGSIRVAILPFSVASSLSVDTVRVAGFALGP